MNEKEGGEDRVQFYKCNPLQEPRFIIKYLRDEPELLNVSFDEINQKQIHCRMPPLTPKALALLVPLLFSPSREQKHVRFRKIIPGWVIC